MNQSELKHLLILTPGFPANEEDTTCLPAVQQFVSAYQKKFPNTFISIISFHYPSQQFSYQWQGINVYCLGGNNKTGKLNTALLVLQAIWIALRINRETKTDAILSLWLRDTAVAGKLASKILSIPYLIWMHGQDAKPSNPYYKIVSPKPENIAAISAYQNNVFHDAYGIKAKHIIHNGIDASKFPPLNETRGIDLYAAGNLVEVKRYHLFIELLKQLKEDGFENIRAVLSGEGVLENELRDLIREYKLDHHIELTGKISHAEVLGFMNNAKIFIHTSEYEGHSGVMIEALYTGCKVLSFIPVDTEAVSDFFICKDLAAMKVKAAELLGEQLSYSKGRLYDIGDSAQQMNNIFLSMHGNR